MYLIKHTVNSQNFYLDSKNFSQVKHVGIIVLGVWSPRNVPCSMPYAWLGAFMCVSLDRWLYPWQLSIASALSENCRISLIHINLGHWLPYCKPVQIWSTLCFRALVCRREMLEGGHGPISHVGGTTIASISSKFHFFKMYNKWKLSHSLWNITYIL